jgi:DNA-binding Xre family transcriptional regulator
LTVGKKNIGSTLESCLEEEGLRQDAEAVAAKRVISYRLAQLMQQQDLTKVELARRMGTSRAALDRLLDPDNPSVTLRTLQAAAVALGGKLEITLVA